jgi:hypothetical protein
VIKYQHAAAGFPIKETWLKAIVCGNYASWLGVTATNVKKILSRVRGNAKRTYEKAVAKCAIDES